MVATNMLRVRVAHAFLSCDDGIGSGSLVARLNINMLSLAFK